MTIINIKRIYESSSPLDGYRVLVDKLWPRGIAKEEAELNEWDKELAPSTELREWLHQNPILHWPEFVQRYNMELEKSPYMSKFISKIKSLPLITLLYASKDAIMNNAVVLQKFIENKLVTI